MREYIKKTIHTLSEKDEPIELECVEAVGTGLAYAPLPDPTLFYLTHLKSGHMLARRSEGQMTSLYVEGEEVARAWIEEIVRFADWTQSIEELFAAESQYILSEYVQRAIYDAYVTVGSQDISDYSHYVATSLYPVPCHSKR